MPEITLLDPVRVLTGPNEPLQKHGAALLRDGHLEALGEPARESARSAGIPPIAAGHQLLAPCLVDVHSFLPEPFQGQGETLESLVRSAAAGGYGQLALLPEASGNRRELPDRLRGFQLADCDVAVRLWGGFSQGGRGEQLTPHADLIEAGAVGLSDGASMPPVPLLDRALTLGESGSSPVLIPPLDIVLRGDGDLVTALDTITLNPTETTGGQPMTCISYALEIRFKGWRRPFAATEVGPSWSICDASSPVPRP